MWKPAQEGAFLAIRTMLSEKCVLRHMDFDAAARPDLTGRPLEMFVDASDYGWAATLCQRLAPHETPKILAIICKPFTEVQLRWSAMERELYALWQGVVGHERLIKGFKTFVYIDHKNNLFTEAQLDNRKRSKKMSNWALELHGFDIVRVWIRGEANILGDAPSRAPWEDRLARHLPIPDMPVRDLVRKMYQDPDGLDLLVKSRAVDDQGVELQWEPIESDELEVDSSPWGAETPEVVESGYVTPRFGTDEATRLAHELGKTVVLWDHDEYMRPRFPCVVCVESQVERCMVGGEAPTKPFPVNPLDLPIVYEEYKDNKYHDHFAVRWPKPVMFTDGVARTSVWFNISKLGKSEARRQAWSYFKRLFDRGMPRASGSGRLVNKTTPSKEGPRHWNADRTMYYHGRESGDRQNTFECWTGFKDVHPVILLTGCNYSCETFDGAEEFCGNAQYIASNRVGNRLYQCLGHCVTRPVGDDSEVEELMPPEIRGQNRIPATSSSDPNPPGLRPPRGAELVEGRQLDGGEAPAGDGEPEGEDYPPAGASGDVIGSDLTDW